MSISGAESCGIATDLEERNGCIDCVGCEDFTEGLGLEWGNGWAVLTFAMSEIGLENVENLKYM